MFDWILGYALIQIPDLLLIAYDYFGKWRITEQESREATYSDSHSQVDVASSLDLKFRNSAEPITQKHQICKVVSKEAHCKNEEAIKVSVDQEIDDILKGDMDRYNE